MSWNPPPSPLLRALSEAQLFRGATAPNPPVGAVVTAVDGKILGVGAHTRAGTPHAEVLALANARENFPSISPHSLWVTLEPCNHWGKTPPCTEAILQSPLQKIIVGARDPNPKVSGGGMGALTAAGRQVRLATEEEGARECEKLLAPFAKWSTSGVPWVTVKVATRIPLPAFSEGDQPENWDLTLLKEAMVPPEGQKTFTSPASLRRAHELRKRADALVTGSGTVLADSPLFTVRHVTDHPQKIRPLLLFDRRHRVPENWIRESEQRGMPVTRVESWAQALEFFNHSPTLEVLVEAGPTLTRAFLKGGFWDELVVFTRGIQGPDTETVFYRDPRPSPSPKGGPNSEI